MKTGRKVVDEFSLLLKQAELSAYAEKIRREPEWEFVSQWVEIPHWRCQSCGAQGTERPEYFRHYRAKYTRSDLKRFTATELLKGVAYSVVHKQVEIPTCAECLTGGIA